MEPNRGEEESASPLFGIGWSTDPNLSICWRRVLTYEGTLRALFTAPNNAVAEYYCSWATRVLFTHHMGTTDMRTQMAADLLGYSVEAVRNLAMSRCYKAVCAHSHPTRRLYMPMFGHLCKEMGHICSL
jgi:hypothetical protein